MAKHQRARMHAATIELVDARGYGALTVAAIVAKAGVSKHTFYENFSDKTDCFLATYKMIVRHTAREILAARRGERGSRARARAGLLAFLRQVAEQPSAARLALIDILEVGGAAKEARRYTSGLFEALIADSLAGEDDGIALPSVLVKGIFAGALGVARTRLLTSQEGQPVDVVDALVQWVFALHDKAALRACLAGSCAESTSMPTATAVVAGSADGPRGQAIGDERAMILAAVAQLTARGDYEALTVTGIRSAAGVSRPCFDRHFDSFAECFLATLAQRTGDALAEARSAFRTAEEWSTGVCLALGRLCECLARDPVLARLGPFELSVSGGEVTSWEAGLVAELRELLLCTAPPTQRPIGLASEASVAAALSVVQGYVMAGKAQRLPSIAGALAYLVLAPSIGPERAASVITTVSSPGRDDYTK